MGDSRPLASDTANESKAPDTSAALYDAGVKAAQAAGKAFLATGSPIAAGAYAAYEAGGALVKAGTDFLFGGGDKLSEAKKIGESQSQISGAGEKLFEDAYGKQPKPGGEPAKPEQAPAGAGSAKAGSSSKEAGITKGGAVDTVASSAKVGAGSESAGIIKGSTTAEPAGTARGGASAGVVKTKAPEASTATLQSSTRYIDIPETIYSRSQSPERSAAHKPATTGGDSGSKAEQGLPGSSPTGAGPAGTSTGEPRADTARQTSQGDRLPPAGSQDSYTKIEEQRATRGQVFDPPRQPSRPTRQETRDEPPAAKSDKPTTHTQSTDGAKTSSAAKEPEAKGDVPSEGRHREDKPPDKPGRQDTVLNMAPAERRTTQGGFENFAVDDRTGAELRKVPTDNPYHSGLPEVKKGDKGQQAKATEESASFPVKPASGTTTPAGADKAAAAGGPPATAGGDKKQWHPPSDQSDSRATEKQKGPTVPIGLASDRVVGLGDRIAAGGLAVDVNPTREAVSALSQGKGEPKAVVGADSQDATRVKPIESASTAGDTSKISPATAWTSRQDRVIAAPSDGLNGSGGINTNPGESPAKTGRPLSQGLAQTGLTDNQRAVADVKGSIGAGGTGAIKGQPDWRGTGETATVATPQRTAPSAPDLNSRSAAKVASGGDEALTHAAARLPAEIRINPTGAPAGSGLDCRTADKGNPRLDLTLDNSTRPAARVAAGADEALLRLPVKLPGDLRITSAGDKCDSGLECKIADKGNPRLDLSLRGVAGAVPAADRPGKVLPGSEAKVVIDPATGKPPSPGAGEGAKTTAGQVPLPEHALADSGKGSAQQLRVGQESLPVTTGSGKGGLEGAPAAVKAGTELTTREAGQRGAVELDLRTGRIVTPSGLELVADSGRKLCLGAEGGRGDVASVRLAFDPSAARILPDGSISFSSASRLPADARANHEQTTSARGPGLQPGRLTGAADGAGATRAAFERASDGRGSQGGFALSAQGKPDHDKAGRAHHLLGQDASPRPGDIVKVSSAVDRVLEKCPELRHTGKDRAAQEILRQIREEGAALGLAAGSKAATAAVIKALIEQKLDPQSQQVAQPGLPPATKIAGEAQAATGKASDKGEPTVAGAKTHPTNHIFPEPHAAPLRNMDGPGSAQKALSGAGNEGARVASATGQPGSEGGASRLSESGIRGERIAVKGDPGARGESVRGEPVRPGGDNTGLGSNGATNKPGKVVGEDPTDKGGHKMEAGGQGAGRQALAGADKGGGQNAGENRADNRKETSDKEADARRHGGKDSRNEPRPVDWVSTGLALGGIKKAGDRKTEPDKPCVRGPGAESQNRDRRIRYIVKFADTLESIAEKYLGDPRFALLLLTINRGVVKFKVVGSRRLPDLRPGQVIWLPSGLELEIHRKTFFGSGSSAARCAPPPAPASADPDPDTNPATPWFTPPDLKIVDGLLPLDPVNGWPSAQALYRIRFAGGRRALPLVALNKIEERAICRRSYIIRLGDTLASIAQRDPLMGDAQLWPLLARINNLEVATDLSGAPVAEVKRGQIIQLPNPDEIEQFKLLQKFQKVAAAALAKPSLRRWTKQCPSVDAAAAQAAREALPPAAKPLPACASQPAPAPAASPPAGIIDARLILDRLSPCCRIITADPGDGSLFCTRLQIVDNGRWITIAAYECRPEAAYRLVYRADGSRQPLAVDLPAPVVRELAREDFLRNWPDYLSRYEEEINKGRSAG